MGTAARGAVLAVAFALVACADPPAPQAEDAPRVLDAGPAGVLVAERVEPPAPETDQPPVHRIVLQPGEGSEDVVVADAARTATVSGDTVLVVDARGVLFTVVDGERRRRVEGVIGRPAVLEDGSAVVAREGALPLESTLWRVPAGSGEARPLTTGTGPDDTPIALPDGRVVFVSGRSTVASLWIVDPATGDLVQLTNRGLAAGRSMAGLVPTPARAESARVVDGRLVFDAGEETWWSVDLGSGEARRLERAP